MDRIDWSQIQHYVIQGCIALGFLLVGWVVALLVSSIISSLVGKTPLNRWLDDMLGNASSGLVPIEKKLKSLIYYFIMIFVLVGFFQTLGLTMITQPLNALLSEIFSFAPRVLGGAGLLILAWAVASILRGLLTKLFDSTKIDDKLSDRLGDQSHPPFGKTVSEAIYWLTFLFFLPAVLDTFALQGMLDPVNEMVSKVTGFLPNLLSAGLLFAIGWFVARVLQRLVSNLMASFGIDALGGKIGLDKAFGSNKISDVVGYLVYVLLLIPVIISSLDALAIEAVSKPATNMLTIIMESLPFIFGGLVILAIGYLLGKAIGTLVTNILATVGFNRVLVWIGLSKEAKDGEKSPAAIMGKLTMLTVLYFAVLEAFHMMGFDTLTDLLEQFLVVAGQILMGVIILGVGLYLANLAHTTIEESGTSNANLLAPAARIAVIVLTTAMALRQMGLANEIINMAFGILLGAIGVAIAIAFGMGGRDVAAKQLEGWQKQLSK